MFLISDAYCVWHPASEELIVVAGEITDVPGLFYTPEFISPVEEQYLLARADEGTWSDYWTRRTQFYGLRYDRAARRIDPSVAPEPLPGWSEMICRRLVERGVLDRLPNQMGINEYLPGQGIAPHVDYFGGTVVSLTLSAGCVMDVVEPDAGKKVSLWLAPRSILVLKHEARNVWKHGIAHRLKDTVEGRAVRRERRVSMTFRDVDLEEAV